MPRELATIQSDDEEEAVVVVNDEMDDEDNGAFTFSFGDEAEEEQAEAGKKKKKAKKDLPGESVKQLEVSAEAAGRDRRMVKAGAARNAHDAADDAAIAAGVFEEVVTDQSATLTFDELQLSRPLLRAVAALGFSAPTPIQQQVIPLCLAGRDVCASAATGSGKTAAFALPTLEKILRLRRTDSRGNVTRCLVVLPTRELAAQCEAMFLQLLVFSGEVKTVLICGGEKDVRKQEVRLRERPEVVVGTPGRLCDHIHNAHSVRFEDVSVAILDEADRLLELGFEEELSEVLKALPGGSERLENQVGTGQGRRQTLLFSATLGTRIESLAKLSLRRPIRVRLESGHGAGGVAAKLTQDFIKLKDTNQEAEREASLLAVLSTTLGANHRTVCFFDQRFQVTRMYLVIEALRLHLKEDDELKLPRVVELHGGLRQSERLANLAKFERGDADCLLCTDVAARGLDVAKVSAVVNSEMPRSLATYVHRVGRTARAGRSGLAVTLVGLKRRAVLKELVRTRQADLDASTDIETLSRDTGDLRSRVLAPGLLMKMRDLVTEAARDITQLERVRRERFDISTAEKEVTRVENVLKFADEIAARPKREWFQSNAERKDLKQKMKEEAEAAELLANDAKPTKEASWGDEADKKPLSATEKCVEAKKPHRLTRAKRRRLEALEALHAPDNSDDEEEPQEPVKKKSAKEKKKHFETSTFDFEGARTTEGAIVKGYAKAAKRREQVKQNDQDLVLASHMPKAVQKQRKVQRDQDAGDEDKPRRTFTEAAAPSTKQWTDFDANKVRSTKKKQQRSKTRHKRK